MTTPRRYVWVLLAACFMLVLPVWAGVAEDTGTWSVTVRAAGAWVTAADLPADAEVYCHLYGVGRFRVLFQQGEATRRYTVDLPAADWTAFTRQLGAGPVQVRVEPLPDDRVPEPKLTGLIATTNPDFRPALADFQHPLYARVTNLGVAPAAVNLSIGCQNPQRYYFDAGNLTANGLAAGTLAAKASSRLLNWSRLPYGRSAFAFRPAPQGETNVEVRLFADAAGTRELTTVRLAGNPAPTVTLILKPQPDGSFTALTTDALMKTRLAELTAALRGDTRPLPKRARITNALGDSGEAMETYRAEAAITRLIGANGAPHLGRLEGERAALGFTSYWSMDFVPISADWSDSQQKARDYAAASRVKLPPGQTSPLIMSDEPNFIEMAKSPALDKRFIAWMQAKGMTPADAGVDAWADVHCIAPSPSKTRLSVLSHQFQCEEEIRVWSEYGQAFRAAQPGLRPAVNFCADMYFNGDTLNLWELYRRPGLEIVWAEDWHSYMPLGMGAIAWYADLMASQAKYRKLPTGTYPILGYGYGPALDAMRYYERFMRGCLDYNLYTYSPRGNEPTWLENPAVMINIARRHRDLAEVEDVLAEGTRLHDRVGLLYPHSSSLWDRTAFSDIFGVYAALLHAGYALEILTEGDLVDGRGKDYALLYVVGAIFRRDVLQALDAFMRAGGTVACSSPAFLDPFNEPIADAAPIFGAARVEIVADAELGRFAYEYLGARPLDTVRIGQQSAPVYGQKSRLTPAAGAVVLATFADGSPAMLKCARGKGMAYLYGFSPGLSYMKADYGNNSGFATGLCRNTVMRAACALPGAARRVACSADMVSSRIIAGKREAVVGLIDYGIGAQGRKMPNLSQAQVDFETMEPYPVTVRIACKTRPTSVRAIRAGKVTWSYAAGTLTVQVPLRGVEMLKLEGTGLF